MKKHAVLRAACWFLCLAPLAVSSTPPAAPPGRGFEFEGSITRAGAGSLANFIVVPKAWDVSRDEEVRFGCAQPDYFASHSHTLTDSEGHFLLSFWLCESPESLAVAVVAPDTLILGSIVPMDALRDGYEVITGYEEHGGEGNGGCDSGEGVRNPRITGYIFSADSLTVPVP